MGDRRGWCPNDEIPAHMGADFPFRGAVQLGMFDMSSNLAICDDKMCACPVDWDNIGYFLRRIENPRQCALVLSAIHQEWPLNAPVHPVRWPDWQAERLSGQDVRRVFREVETKGKGLPLKIVRRDFDDRLMSGECVAKDGVWRSNFALIEGESVIEYNYVIDQRNRIARRAWVLVAGPIRQKLGPLPEDGGHNPLFVTNALPLPETPDVRIAHRCEHVLLAAAYLTQWRKDLGSSDETTRRRAFNSISRLGETAKDAVPELLGCMTGPGKIDPYYVGKVLQEVGPAALPELRKALKNPDRHVREKAAEAFCSLGEAAKDDVPALEEIVRAIQEPEACRRAVQRLGGIGPAAVPALRKLLGDNRAVIRHTAAYVLGEIGPPAKDAIPELRRLLADRDPSVREAAICALGGIGPAAKESAPDLRKFLEDKNPETRLSTVFALVHIGEPPKDALPWLRTMLTDINWNYRRWAIEAIGYIAPQDAETISELQAALKSRQWDIQAAAAEALGRIGPAAKDAVPELRAAVRGGGVNCRTAIVALGRMGPAAKDAIPDLRDAQKRGGDIRDEAIKAIQAIEH
jgi:HEAT repeat protein